MPEILLSCYILQYYSKFFINFSFFFLLLANFLPLLGHRQIGVDLVELFGHLNVLHMFLVNHSENVDNQLLSKVLLLFVVFSSALLVLLFLLGLLSAILLGFLGFFFHHFLDLITNDVQIFALESVMRDNGQHLLIIRSFVVPGDVLLLTSENFFLDVLLVIVSTFLLRVAAILG